MAILLFVLAALATWRASSLLARERGFFALGMRARSLFGIEHAPDGTPSFDEDGEVLLRPVTPSARVDTVLHEIAQGLVCIWCNSVWVAGFMTLLVASLQPFLIIDLATFVMVLLALSAGAILIERILEGE